MDRLKGHTGSQGTMYAFTILAFTGGVEDVIVCLITLQLTMTLKL